VVGSLVAGLIGYRARPSAFELASYVAFAAAAGYLFFGQRRFSGRPPRPSSRPVENTPQRRQREASVGKL
jgi:high-affinity Fe2+/Pb2+ permease